MLLINLIMSAMMFAFYICIIMMIATVIQGIFEDRINTILDKKDKQKTLHTMSNIKYYYPWVLIMPVIISIILAWINTPLWLNVILLTIMLIPIIITGNIAIDWCQNHDDTTMLNNSTADTDTTSANNNANTDNEYNEDTTDYSASILK